MLHLSTNISPKTLTSSMVRYHMHVDCTINLKNKYIVQCMTPSLLPQITAIFLFVDATFFLSFFYRTCNTSIESPTFCQDIANSPCGQKQQALIVQISKYAVLVLTAFLLLKEVWKMFIFVLKIEN